MTLVVGRTSERGRVRVTADLRVTDSDDIRRGYPYAALKNVILSETILVASAGNADLAMHTMRTLPPRRSTGSEVVPILLEAARTAGPGDAGVDFLVGEIGVGLHRITREGAECDIPAAWIGDAKAFEVYQRGYHDPPVTLPTNVEALRGDHPMAPTPDEIEEAIRMHNGIRLLDEGHVPSVGEAYIEAIATHGGFRYAPQAVLTASHEQVIESGEWVPVDWGTVAQGGFGYSVMAPVEAGIGTLGLYFPHGRLGLLYKPLARDDVCPYPGVSQERFAELVQAEHGIEISGPTFG